jgi:hypothetical protein
MNNVKVERWAHFKDEVLAHLDVVKEKAKTINLPTLADPADLFDTVSFRLKKEAQVQGLFIPLGIVVSRVIRPITGRKLKMEASGEAALNPDIQLGEMLEDDRYILRSLVEVKTPFGFQPEDSDIVQQFHNEQEPKVMRNIEYTSKLRSHSSQNTSRPSPRQLNPTNSNKITRAVCQLWAYLTVNNLRYGVITTFNETYFVRRVEGDGSSSTLQFSPAVTLCDTSVPIIAAWVYFVSLTFDNHLYSSPYGTPTMTRKNIDTEDPFALVETDMSNVYFECLEEFSNAPLTTLGWVGPKTKNNFGVLKMFDQLKDSLAFLVFSRELEAYRRLTSCQGIIVPTLKKTLLLSGFLYTLFLEDCGAPISRKQLIESFDQVKQALQSLHELGVLHNDVAMRNILFHDSGRITIIDFGQSKFFDSSSTSSSSDENIITDSDEWRNECEAELQNLHDLLSQ